MTKYRVYEVADEMGVETSQLIQMLREMDIPVRSHMSTVEPAQVARLHARLERERRGENQQGGGEGGTRRRRRRRRAPTQIETPVAVDATADVTSVEVDEEPEVEAPDPEPTVVEAEPGGPVEEPEEAEAVEAVVAQDDAAGSEDVAAAAEPEPEEAETQPSGAEVDEEKAAEAVESARAEADEEESGEAPEPDAPETPSAEAPAAETPEAPTPVKRRRPKPVRRDMPTPAAPTASAAPGGTVRISAEGYTVDGRKKSRRDRKKRRRVDRDAVQENVKKTLASLDGPSGSSRRRRREPNPQDVEAERERQELQKQAEKTTVRVNEFLTVSELADLIDVSPQAIIKSAFKNLGLMVTINQRLDFDQIELICEEAGYTAVREESYEADLAEIEPEDEDTGEMQGRPPVVTVMGHVDHGKTSLLDYIRSANVIAGEAGGITQHIGAYHVELDGGRTITFLDTPGHEAFTAMRARGAEATDIVILVVAADDSVMPQTIEAISHSRNAGVPVIVAINKIDLPSANVDKVKQELLSHDVVLEEFGGDTLSAAVSAKKGTGIEDLLEKVLLQAELLELKASPDRDARGVVVEAELDRGMGPVATVLIQNGTLEVGDDFVCGVYSGRVRALLDERGQSVDSAGPGIPVRVLGIEGVPQAGDGLIVLEADRVREIVTRRQQLEREKDIRRRATGTKLEDIFERIQAGEQATLNIVIKGDTDGSVQALSDSLERLSTDEVAVQVIHRAVGGITESDVLLASTSQALIIGFHVRPDPNARATAEREDIEIRIYNVIYEAVEDTRLALEGLLEPEQREVTLGTAEVRELFRVPRVGTVAGCYVSDGIIRRNLPVRLLRDQVQIYEGRIGSLKRFKEDVREVRDGFECGIGIEGYNDVKVGDMIECFEVKEIARKLESA